MFNKYLLVSCLFMVSGYAFADESSESDDLRYNSGFLGNRYYLNDKLVSRGKVKKHLSSNPEALEAFNKSNLPYYGGLGLAALGGAAIGNAFGAALAEDESVNGGTVGAGIALIGLSFYVVKRSENHVARSIDLFNSANVSLKPDSSRNRLVRTGVFITTDAVGVSLRF